LLEGYCQLHSTCFGFRQVLWGKKIGEVGINNVTVTFKVTVTWSVFSIVLPRVLANGLLFIVKRILWLQPG
jgi:hypothetical protein